MVVRMATVVVYLFVPSGGTSFGCHVEDVPKSAEMADRFRSEMGGQAMAGCSECRGGA